MKAQLVASSNVVYANNLVEINKSSCLIYKYIELESPKNLKQIFRLIFLLLFVSLLFPSITNGQSEAAQVAEALSEKAAQIISSANNISDTNPNLTSTAGNASSSTLYLSPDKLSPSDFENIDVFTGQMRINFPLLRLGGRGPLQIPLVLRTRTKPEFRFEEREVNSTQTFLVYDTESGFSDEGYVLSGGGNAPTYVGGMMRPEAVVMKSHTSRCRRTIPCGPNSYCFQYYKNGITLTKLIYTAPDGTVYELRDQLHDGKPLNPLGNCFTPGPSRGRVFLANDGSGAMFISDTDVYDPGYGTGHLLRTGAGTMNGYMKFPDGSVARIENWRTIWIRDSNGNEIKFYYDPQINQAAPSPYALYPIPYGRVNRIVDSLGREVNLEYGIDDLDGQVPDYGFHDKITYKGVGGQTREIRITRALLASSLRSDQQVRSIGYLWTETPLKGQVGQGYWVDEETPQRLYNPLVPVAVWLPDGRKHRFLYNSYAELARVETATGGAIEYDYAAGINQGQPEQNPYKSGFHWYRRAIEKRNYNNGGTGAGWSGKTTFSQTTGIDGGQNQYVDISQFESNGQKILTQRSYFYGQAGLSIADKTSPYIPWRLGREYKTEMLNPSTSDVLQKVESNWTQRASVNWWHQIPIRHDDGGLNAGLHPFEDFPIEGNQVSYLQPGVNCNGLFCRNPLWNAIAEDEPQLDSRVTEVITTIEPSGANLVSKKNFNYDAFNNPTDTYEYDFGTGQAGSLIRRSHTQYITDSNYIEPFMYDGDGNPIQVDKPVLRSLLNESWISSDIAGNNKLTLTRYECDNYSSDLLHAPLINRPNISGHSTSFNVVSGYLWRGNVTKVTSYSDAANQTGGISVYSQYDIAGNVVKVIDGNSVQRGPQGGQYDATTFDYTDCFGTPDDSARCPSPQSGAQTYAFVTKTINPIGFTIYSQYDFHSGGLVNAEDIRGNITVMFTLNDPLDRIKQTISAVNRPTLKRQTTVNYDDINRLVTTTGDLKTYGDNSLKSESFYDGFGRTTESRSYEGDSYIASQVQYDALGRAYKTSNPFRLGDPIKWSITKFDALGRVHEVETPDGAKMTRSYSGNQVTVTDQAGKRRRGISDALGRVKQVIEDPNESGQTNRLNYVTDYTFDAVGNLRKTAQGGQARFFMYDSLGRVVRVKQPEQAVNTNLPPMTDPLTGNNQWSVAYTYDFNGNNITTTDTRNITITGTYDKLNRLTFRNYSDLTPDVAFTYDDSAVPNSIGALTTITSSESITKFTAFDQLGRVKSNQQITGGQTFNFNDYSYDLAGNLISQTYPTGRIINYNLDDEGRVASISGRQPNQLAKVYASNLRYTAFGAVDRVKLGNGTWETAEFDFGRLQVKKIALGTNSTNANLLKLEYDYGTVQENNGSLRKQTITVPTVGGATGFTAVQTYAYDALNRLQSTVENPSGSQTVNWQQTFSYDRFGNRTAVQTATAGITEPSSKFNNPQIDPNNNRFIVQQDGDGQMDYNYDAAGNLILDAAGRRFVYDAENKQKSFGNNTQGDNGGQYFYDGTGKRVKKVMPGSTVNTEIIFVYDAFGKLVLEHETSEALATSDGTRYLTTDHLGSPRAITDQNGTIVARHDYMAFGEDLHAGVGGRTAGSETTPGQRYSQYEDIRQQFTGYERDRESGLDYAQARYYNNGHGRFTGVDPLTASASIKNPQTFNRYTYALNSPYKFTDPTGLCSESDTTNACRIDTISGDLVDPRLTGSGEFHRASSSYQRRLQNTMDVARGNRAIAAGDYGTAFAIVASNSDISIQVNYDYYVYNQHGQQNVTVEVRRLLNEAISKMATNIIRAIIAYHNLSNNPSKGSKATFELSGEGSVLAKKITPSGVGASFSIELEFDSPDGILRDLGNVNDEIRFKLVGDLEKESTPIPSASLPVNSRIGDITADDTYTIYDRPVTLAASFGALAVDASYAAAQSEYIKRYPDRLVPKVFQPRSLKK